MNRTAFLLALLFCLILWLPSYTRAEDEDIPDEDIEADDRIGFSSEAEAVSPGAIAPLTQYEFSFVVHNTSSNSYVQRWIGTVDLFMPSMGYVVDLDNVSEPDGLHFGTWQFAYYEAYGRQHLTWRNLGMWRTFFGDIREGEHLEFSFIATTDEGPTDGFQWKTIADSGEMAIGWFFVGIADDDVDDDVDDDDTSAPDDDTGDDDDGWSDDDDDDFGQLNDDNNDDDDEESETDDTDLTGSESSCGC